MEDRFAVGVDDGEDEDEDKRKEEMIDEGAGESRVEVREKG